MNDGSGKYCDICGTAKDVKYYHSIDLDICEKCLPMFVDMLDGKLHVNGNVQNSSNRGTGASGETENDND